MKYNKINYIDKLDRKYSVNPSVKITEPARI